METTEVLYTRNFTDLGPLQSAHVLQYALTTDPGCALRYGVSVTVLQAGGRDTQSCRAICDTQEGTCRLLVFLWENAVEPCAVRGIVEDIRGAAPMNMSRDMKILVKFVISPSGMLL